MKMIKKILTICLIFTVLFTNIGSNYSYASNGNVESDSTVANEQFDEIKSTLTPITEQFSAQLEGGNATNCLEILTPLYDVETLVFLNFLEANFQNKAANDSLTNIAIAKYRGYRNTLQDYYAEMKAKESTARDIQTFDATFKALQVCEDLTNAYIDLAKQKMIEHIKNTSAQKKTTAYVEKYKSINDGLRDLNFKIAMMYSNFLTFKNKLPGFVCSRCVTQ